MMSFITLSPYLLRTRSIPSPSTGTFIGRKYGAGRVRVMIRYIFESCNYLLFPLSYRGGSGGKEGKEKVSIIRSAWSRLGGYA